MTDRSRARPLEVVPPLDELQIEDLLLYLLRSPAVQAAADGMLLDEHFHQHEVHLSLLWTISCEHRERYGQLTYIDIKRAVREVMDAGLNNPFTQKMYDRILVEDPYDRTNTGLLDLAFNHVTPGQIQDTAGLDLLRRFLQERKVTGPLRQTLLSIGQAIPVDFSAMIDAVGEAQRAVSVLGQDTDILPFASQDGQDVAANCRAAIPMPIAALARLMPFGMAANEAYTIVAPPGYGKTTILTELAVATGAYFVWQADTAGEPLKTVRVYSWEGRADEVIWRLQANAAQIQKQRLEDAVLRQQLSSNTRNDYQPYEDGIQVSDRAFWLGEQERLERARWLDRVIRIQNMNVRGKGERLLNEVIADCEAATRRGEVIGLITLDHAMAMANRHITAGHAKPDHMRHILAGIADQAAQISIRFSCPVWIAHQTATSNLGRGAIRGRQGGAAECKAWEQPFNIAIDLSAADIHKRQIMTNTKDRRSGMGQAHTVVQLDGALQRVKDLGSRFHVDAIGRIVDSNANQIFSGTMAGQLSTSTPPIITPGSPIARRRQDGVVS